ncbi:MAG: NAD(P)-dependent oxidoreductase [Polyangiaceae bacterium]|nr:NAD(P)-dependent oxidoreductase [Polyangiaceae bacterium]
MSHIAFLGTGMIGSGLAEAALGRGERVFAWNRSVEKARALEPLGARVAASPAEAVGGATRVHVALSDDAAVDAVLEQAAPAIGREALVLDHSTTSPAGTAARAAACERRGVEYLHVPVFMSPALCRAAKGLMISSGPRARFDRALPFLSKMTGEVLWLGERPDLAACFKLFGNAMIVTIVGGLSDVFAMAAAQGVDPADALSLFSKFNPATTIEMRGARMARAEFSPASFELAMARKDVRLMIEAAGDLPLAVLPRVAERIDEVIAAGHGADDLAALAVGSIERARRGA